MLKTLTFQQKLLVFTIGVIVLMGIMLAAIGYLYVKKYPIDKQTVRSLQRKLGVEQSESKAKEALVSARQYVKLGDFDQALIDYTNCIKEPHEADTTEEAYVELAKLHVIEGDYDSALKVLADGIKKVDEPFELLEQKAYIHKALGMRKQELESCNLGVASLSARLEDESDQNKAYYFWKRADRWMKLGNSKKATADFRKALEDYRKQEEPEDKLWLYKRLKSDEVTRKEMREDIKKLTNEINDDKEDEDQSDLYHHRAGVFEALNDIDAAEKDYKRAQEIDPDTDDYPTHLAKIMLRRKQYAEAAKLFNELALRDEEDAPSWNLAAEAMMLAGQNKEAIETADKAIKLDPFDADGYYVKGQAMKKLSDDKASGDDLIKTAIALGYEEEAN